jgi:hypothetical protein
MGDMIIEELWGVKDAIAQEYGYDVDALVSHLREVTRPYGSRVVDLAAMRGAEQVKARDTDKAPCP